MIQPITEAEANEYALYRQQIVADEMIEWAEGVLAQTRALKSSRFFLEVAALGLRYKAKALREQMMVFEKELANLREA